MIKNIDQNCNLKDIVDIHREITKDYIIDDLAVNTMIKDKRILERSTRLLDQDFGWVDLYSFSMRNIYIQPLMRYAIGKATIGLIYHIQPNLEYIEIKYEVAIDMNIYNYIELSHNWSIVDGKIREDVDSHSRVERLDFPLGELKYPNFQKDLANYFKHYQEFLKKDIYEAYFAHSSTRAKKDDSCDIFAKRAQKLEEALKNDRISEIRENGDIDISLIEGDGFSNGSTHNI